MNDLLKDFLDHIQWTKKQSPHTLKSYETDLRQIFKPFIYRKKPLKRVFASSQKKPVFPTLVGEENLENYIKKSVSVFFQKNRRLSSASQNRKLASARGFIKWLFENDYIQNDARWFFKSPKMISKIPNVLSVDEVFSVIHAMQAAQSQGAAHIKRDQCLFFLLYGGGLRVSEACRLKTRQINWRNKTLRIKGKGGKERLIAASNRVFFHLKPFKKNQPYIFGKPLPERKAYDIIRGWGKRAGLLKAIHPHVLRHSFATHLLISGSDLRTLQELLGHKTLTATQRYIHLDLMHLSRVLETRHPINLDFQNSLDPGRRPVSAALKP